MVNRALPALALAGCFGGGPTPTLPDDVTVLFHAPAAAGSCSAAYIADVALGANGGIAVTAPYLPWQGNCSGMASGDFQIVGFTKQGGGGAMMLGTVPSNGMFAAPRVAVADDVTAWASFQSSSGSIGIGPVGTMISPMGTGGPSPSPGGIALDASGTPAVAYVAAWNPSTSIVPTFPYFPCCTGGNNQNSPSYSFDRIAMASGAGAVAMPVTPRFWCDDVRTCLTATSHDLIYVQHADPAHAATVDRFPKDGLTASDEVELGVLDHPPAGLAADEDHVAWTESYDFAQLGQIQSQTTLPPLSCTLAVAPLAGPATQLLSTSRFACGDVAVAGGDVFFLIIGLDDSGHGVVEHTSGIGRIRIADGTLESVALGLEGFGAGPRGLAVDADSIYLFDPLLVARVPKSAVEGHSDFAP